MAKDPTSDVGPPPSEVTISGLVELLGESALRVVEPGRPDAPVIRPVIHDPLAPPDLAPGDLLLAVGLAGDTPELRSAVRHMAAAGATGVVIRSDIAVPIPIQEEARAAGLAVLLARPSLSWGQLHTLVRGAVAEAGRLSETRAGDLPLGDLFALADAIAASVGGSVTIDDPQSTILAYSTNEQPIDGGRLQTILDRRVPEDWLPRIRAAGVFDRLWRADGPVRFDEADAMLGFTQPRLAIAVRAGGDVLGSIWVAEGERPLRADAEQALRDAADIAALHLIRHRAGDDLERQRRGEVLRALIQGRDPGRPVLDDVLAGATLVAFELDADDDARLEVALGRALGLASLRLESYYHKIACAVVDRRVYVLVPAVGPGERAKLASLAGDVVDDIERTLGVSVRAGVGSSVSDAARAHQSRIDADRALQVARDAQRSRPVIDIDSVRAEVALRQTVGWLKGNADLHSPKLAGLAEHDRDQGSDYIGTLRAYLEHFGDVGAAAAAIHVHPNTFRYRLRRLQEISGLDLDNWEERAGTQLQLLAFLAEDARFVD